MDAFVTTTGLKQQDTREEAMARATATLDNAKKCPVCQDVHMFDIRKHEGIQFPLTQFNSCKQFKDLSPERKGTVLEEQSGRKQPKTHTVDLVSGRTAPVHLSHSHPNVFSSRAEAYYPMLPPPLGNSRLCQGHQQMPQHLISTPLYKRAMDLLQVLHGSP